MAAALPPADDAADSGAGDPAPVADHAVQSEASRDVDAQPAPSVQVLDKPEFLRHRAVPMETTEQVAYRYGVSVERLRKWNGLSDEFALHKVWRKPKLKVWARRKSPPRRKVEHTVEPDETWGSIARDYGVASTDMRAYNVKKIGRKFEVGDALDIWIDPVIYAEIQRGPTPEGLRRGAFSIGSPNEGRLVNAVKLPPSEDYELGYPNSVWGTTSAVGALVRAFRSWRTASGYAGKLRIGTMSRQRGGEVGHHKSHQTGRDIDIRLPLKEEVPQGLKPEAWRVDWWATYQLIEALLAEPETSVIFFDYKLQRRLAKAAEANGVDAEQVSEILQWPIGSKASRGRVRHEPGHTQHIHVRFHCAAYETECVE